MLAEYSVKIYKIDPFFFNHYEELIKVGKNGSNCILFRIDIYFLNIMQLQKLMKKDMLTEISFKRQEALDKNFNWEFLRTKTSGKNYGADNEISTIQSFIIKSAKRIMVNEILI